jgi:hypothetical protein
MVDMLPPPQQDILTLAKQVFGNSNLGDPCITALAAFLQPNKLRLIPRVVFAVLPFLKAVDVSELREGVLPFLERYYVRGAKSGLDSVLNPNPSEEFIDDAFEAEGLAYGRSDLENQRERLNSLIGHLERSFPSKTVEGALDILRGHERGLFNEGYEFGKTQAEAQALLPDNPVSTLG